MVETRSQAKQAPQNEASSAEFRPETLGLPAIKPEAYHMFCLFMERFMKEQEEKKALMVTPEPENEKAAKQKRKKKMMNKSSPRDQDEDYLSSDSAISRGEKPKLLPLIKKKTTKKSKKGKEIMIESSSPSPITTESSEEKPKRKRKKDHGNNYKHDKEVSFKKNTQFLKGDDERKNKHPGWSYDRKFTPLSQPQEKIQEYLLAKGTTVLPKVSEPPKMMGGNKEKLCKFLRAPGHDTEDCFVLKNIIQDFINKDLKICDDSTPEILRNPFPDHGKAAVAMITTGTPLQYHPQDHIRPYIGSSSQKVMVVDQGKEPLDFIAMMNDRTKSLPKKLPMILRTFILQGDESSDVSLDEDPCYLDILSLEERMVEEHSVQTSKNQSITFSEKDLQKWGYFHEDALYIVVQVNGMTVPHVLIDGGSGLNICPDLTAKTLGFREDKYRSNDIKIYRYDSRDMNSKGTLDMNVTIENTSHHIVFHVVDVPPSYNLLLGGPWVHQVQGIPSTLHQCLKWNFGTSVITIRTEDPTERLVQPMIPRPIDPVDVPIIRTTKDEPLEEWMQNMTIGELSKSAHIVSSNHASYQEHPLYVHSMKNPKGFQLLLKGGYRPFTSLGKNEDGILQPISIPFQINTRGLGYHEGI
ncbi:hypothetical protein EJ110_NYTH18079 [Nymphaea thermarum]|nr:hypothetical protein EJ110_NYTH18079 [Nymphaea thermarum]